MKHQDASPARAGDVLDRQWPAAMAAETFSVEFGLRVGLSSVAADSFKFIGKGSISFDDGTVSISGARKRPFRRSLKETHAFESHNIVNAALTGRTICFQLRTGNGSPRKVQLVAANEAQGRAILSRLPTEQTPEFAHAQAEFADFHARLDYFSPRAPVTPTLVALNVAVFIAMCIGGMNFIAPDGETAVRWGSNFGPMTLNGQWWRLFTATFIHFGIIHLAFNMWALFQSGRTIERLFGSTRFVLLYVFSGLTGSLASLLWNPDVNSAGASGAIFGIFGGLLAFVINPRNGVPKEVMSEHRNSTLLFAGYSLFYGFAHSGIDNAAHIGGLVGGFAMGLLLARPLSAESHVKPGTPRLLVATAAGIALLVLMAWPLANPSGQAQGSAQFQRSLMTFSTREKAAIEAAKTLFAQGKTGNLSIQAVIDSLQKNVAPQWDAIYGEMAAVKLQPDSADYPFQQALLRYVDARRQELHVFAYALSPNDAMTEESMKTASQNTQAALAEVNRLAAARK